MKFSKPTKRAGKYEELTHDLRAIIDVPVSDGFSCNISKLLSPHFQVGHSIGFGQRQAPPSYMFKPMYAKNNFSLMGGVDPSGNVSMQTRYVVGSFGAVSATAQAMPSQGAFQYGVEAEAYGPTTTVAVKAHSTPFFGAGMTQAITDNIAIGGEVLHVVARKMTIGSAGGRVSFPAKPASELIAKYTKQDKKPATATQPDLGQVVSVNVNSMKTVTAGFVRQLSERFTAAVEVEANIANKKMVSTVAYEGRFPEAVVKASANSQGQVMSSVSHQLAPGATLSLSAGLSFKDNGYVTGMGISFGQ
ncbi:Eukaryotic porin/Tom40 [Carpediemonas membranifera]|uniref:Eukaryotic porin/Tom40 n=1 Tax=Carpediemonas membranifera TaxID=201153 RepID=A0A8J6AU81_9EUKA|nr:Eukaryotic porin/Tom40 [Carpediemonas membranifera]|eukprot:KAG9392600.1 Eukaryotic porin/Tom40 [Carpediemonas membranifera]